MSLCTYGLQLEFLTMYLFYTVQVFPAAGYAHEVKRRGGKVAIFNMERTNGDSDADFVFLGPCEQTLPACLGVQFQS